MRERRKPGDRRKTPAGKPSKPLAGALVVNGWTLLAHPLFIEALEALVAAVKKEQSKKPGVTGGYTTLLANILDLAFVAIPSNPASPAFRHGGALGGGNREWFRGKTGNGRYRLFFRFSSGSKVIIYGWINDENSLRTRGTSTDAYAVFASMLKDGNPPAAWDDLMKAANNSKIQSRLAGLAPLGKKKKH